MNNKVKNKARDIITIGLKEGEKQIAPSQIAPADDNKLTIDGIKNLEESLRNTDTLQNFFNNDFFKDNFKVLNDSASSNITTENFIKIQSEVTLLHKIQIELIEFVDAKQSGQIKKLDGDKIMQAFQNSPVYKKYFDQQGINAKLNEYKESNLDEIPTFNDLIKIKEVPNLEINYKSNFQDVALNLENYIKELDNSSKKNLQFATLKPNKENLDKIKMITLKSDPLILAMMTRTKDGQKIQIEMEKQSFGTKAGKFVLISLLLVATATVACIITGLAAPAIVTALGGTVLTKIGVGVGTTVIMTGVGAVSKIVGNEIDKIGNKDEKDRKLSGIVDKIEDIKIKDELSKSLLKDFDVKPENNIILSVKKETKIGIG